MSGSAITTSTAITAEAESQPRELRSNECRLFPHRGHLPVRGRCKRNSDIPAGCELDGQQQHERRELLPGKRATLSGEYDAGNHHRHSLPEWHVHLCRLRGRQFGHCLVELYTISDSTFPTAGTDRHARKPGSNECKVYLNGKYLPVYCTPGRDLQFARECELDGQ